MHQNSPFWAQKSKNCLGRGHSSLPRPLPPVGRGTPPSASRSSRLRRLTRLAPLAGTQVVVNYCTCTAVACWWGCAADMHLSHSGMRRRTQITQTLLFLSAQTHKCTEAVNSKVLLEPGQQIGADLRLFCSQTTAWTMRPRTGIFHRTVCLFTRSPAVSACAHTDWWPDWVDLHVCLHTEMVHSPQWLHYVGLKPRYPPLPSTTCSCLKIQLGSLWSAVSPTPWWTWSKSYTQLKLNLAHFSR